MCIRWCVAHWISPTQACGRSARLSFEDNVDLSISFLLRGHSTRLQTGENLAWKSVRRARCFFAFVGPPLREDAADGLPKRGRKST